ncbi:hypothetical protein HIM_06828 [Hirsutella minnesotensis 3608]|uniref:Uncharacterized protein n=1 Tax=Hirsutella minnesotensis 3608 TaxID=1043627 RepID=A0A0F7ZNG5_9HYPO|nr:hypothetical protein HIM_06828 [Hirsutella minnesotensis 3608]
MLMPFTKTYIVSPSFTISPKALQLGDILVGPLSPNLDPINHRCRQPIDPENLKEVAVWEAFSSTRGELLRGRLGLWTTLLATVGSPVGMNFGLLLERDAKDVITAPELQTHEFIVTDEYVAKVLAQDAVKSYLGRRNYRVPVYMVNGVKIAKGGGSVNVDRPATVDAQASITAPQQLVEVKPFFQALRTRVAVCAFTSKTDFVLAFRVERIVFKNGLVKDHQLSVAGATMLDGHEGVKDFEVVAPHFYKDGDLSWPEAVKQADEDEVAIFKFEDETSKIIWLSTDEEEE